MGSSPVPFVFFFVPVAQWLEQVTVNHKVVGSSPVRGVNFLKQMFFNILAVIAQW